MSPTPAIAVLEAADVRFQVHSYAHDPAVTSYGREAADALGIAPERMFKTLVVSLNGKQTDLVTALVPVSGELNLKQLAAAVGAKKAAMAEPATVTRSTGYVLGGVSPLGQRTVLRTVIDQSCRAEETIFVSAGRRGLDIELAPTDLIAVLDAIVAPIGR